MAAMWCNKSFSIREAACHHHHLRSMPPATTAAVCVWVWVSACVSASVSTTLSYIVNHPLIAICASPYVRLLLFGQAVRRGQWSDVRYRGDPLRRPIASYEVPIVARWAVRASEAANRALRLDEPPTGDDASPSGPIQVQLDSR